MSRIEVEAGRVAALQKSWHGVMDTAYSRAPKEVDSKPAIVSHSIPYSQVKHLCCTAAMIEARQIYSSTRRGWLGGRLSYEQPT